MREDSVQIVPSGLEAEARHVSDDLFEILFEYAPDAYFLADVKGTFIGVNKAAETLASYQKEELVGKSFLKLDILPRDQIQKTLKLLALNAMRKPTEPEEFTLRRKDGSRVFVEIRTYPVTIKGKTVVLGIARDITERRKAKEQLEENIKRLRKSMESIIQAITLTIDLRDPNQSGHQRRVADLALAIATEVSLSQDKIDTLLIACLIHDLGKISIPGEILNKPGRLDEAELQLIREHPKTGYDILRKIDLPGPIAEIVYQHHERIDGSGYPRGLAGQEILLEARILGVAEAVEAMASHRPYRPAMSIEKTLEEISRNKGILYDRDVVEACLRVFVKRKFEFK